MQRNLSEQRLGYPHLWFVVPAASGLNVGVAHPWFVLVPHTEASAIYWWDDRPIASFLSEILKAQTEKVRQSQDSQVFPIHQEWRLRQPILTKES